MNFLIASSVLVFAATASKVESVVVYPDRAQVVRVASVPCGPKAQALFTQIPPSADVNSFRARASGGAVAGMRVETQTREEQFSSELVSLQAQLRKVEEQKTSVADELRRVENASQLGAQYAELAVQMVGPEMASPQPDLRAWSGALELSLNARMSAAAKVAELTTQGNQLNRKAKELQRKIAQLSASAKRREYLAEVLIACPSGRAAQVELSYLVGGASWTPSYEARTDEVTDTVDFTTYATLQQTTGEDWTSAKVTLSTAVPAQNATPPQLQPLQVFAEERAEQKKVLVRREEAVRHAQGGKDEGTGKAEGLRADRLGLSVQLQVPDLADVPGNGTPARLLVGTAKMKARFAYRTVPKLMPFVFRVAELVNTAPYPLLPGMLDVFRANGFIGRYTQERVAEGGVFQLTFGVEEQMRVDRTPIEEIQRDAGLFSGKKRFRYAYRFELANYARKPVEVELAEHVPVSEREDIVVIIDSKSTSGYQHAKDDGILTWKLALKPTEKKTVILGFYVDVPESYESGGL